MKGREIINEALKMRNLPDETIIKLAYGKYLAHNARACLDEANNALLEYRNANGLTTATDLSEHYV